MKLRSEGLSLNIKGREKSNKSRSNDLGPVTPYLSMDLFACRRCSACIVGVDVCGGCPLQRSEGLTIVTSGGGQGLQTQHFFEFQVPAWKFLFCAKDPGGPHRTGCKRKELLTKKGRE